MTTGTFNGTGSDCNGSSGDANRVLTLANTGITKQNGFLVYASGLALAVITEYTVDHNSSGTEITFLNSLWDDMTLVVNYTENLTGVGNDFINGPIVDFGVEVTRTPVTKTTDFHGDKTYTDGTNETITVVFGNPDTKYSLDKPGITKVYDALMYVKPAQTINKYDKITHQSKVFRVETVSIRSFDGNDVYKTVGLYYASE